MEFVKIEKKDSGKFIVRYDITYRTEAGNEKVYEMISRDRNMDSLEKLQTDESAAVALIIHDETGEKLLLNREFRLAPAKWVYNFPAGLIDKGETPEEAAKRELKEETGLELVEIDDIIRSSYSDVGLSNEKSQFVIGKAKGEFARSTSDEEEIEPVWVTKEEMRKLIKKDEVPVYTLGYCYAWSRK